MKTPTVLFGVTSRDGQLSLNVRLVELVERFDFDHPSDTARHANQKVGNDVSASPRSSRSRRVVLVHQPNLRSGRCLAPGVLNLQRLLLNRFHKRAVRQDHGRGRF